MARSLTNRRHARAVSADPNPPEQNRRVRTMGTHFCANGPATPHRPSDAHPRHHQRRRHNRTESRTTDKSHRYADRSSYHGGSVSPSYPQAGQIQVLDVTVSSFQVGYRSSPDSARESARRDIAAHERRQSAGPAFTNVPRTASAVSEVRPYASCMELEVRPASEVERFVAFARASGCQCRVLFRGQSLDVQCSTCSGSHRSAAHRIGRDREVLRGEHTRRRARHPIRLIRVDGPPVG